MVAVAVDGGEGGHVEQEPREGVEEVVIEVQLRQLGAEGERVGDGAILEAVVGEAELGEPLEPPNVRREGAEVVGAEGEDGDVGAVLEQLLGQERVGVAPRGGYVVEVQLHEVERPVNMNNECLSLPSIPSYPIDHEYKHNELTNCLKEVLSIVF